MFFLPHHIPAVRKGVDRYKRFCLPCPRREKGNPPRCGASRTGGYCGDLARENRCPDDRFGQRGYGETPLPAQAVRVRTAWDDDKGPQLWARLHLWALTRPSETTGWIEDFLREIPCGSCAEHARAFVASDPPPAGKDAFVWSVRLHNAVNARLGKETIDEGEARRLWDISGTFDGCYVLSLEEDAGRLAVFQQGLRDFEWPFKTPTVVQGVDGIKEKLPEGAVGGCMEGHRRMLRAARNSGNKSALFLEDDALLRPGFAASAAAFLAKVPTGWDGIWWGHQSSWWKKEGGLAKAAAPGVVRTPHPHRGHAYALRGKALEEALSVLEKSGGHADHALGPLGGKYRFYAPDPPLIGQAAGWSRLMNRSEGDRFWDAKPSGPDVDRPVVILPFYGEFGHLVLDHVRYVHALPAVEKVVCCERGQECLFPTATGFVYDWKHPLADSSRAGSGSIWQGDHSCAEADEKLCRRLRLSYPCHSLVRPSYGNHWDIAPRIKFLPQARHSLPPVDVVVGARNRKMGTSRTFPHWASVVVSLKEAGFRIGQAGAKGTSLDLNADTFAWDHPDGPTAGTIDLLSHCRIYTGTDTGPTHIAALMDVPMVVFRISDGTPDYLALNQKVTKGPFRRLSEAVWKDPAEVVETILKALNPVTAQ